MASRSGAAKADGIRSEMPAAISAEPAPWGDCGVPRSARAYYHSGESQPGSFHGQAEYVYAQAIRSGESAACGQHDGPDRLSFRRPGMSRESAARRGETRRRAVRMARTAPDAGGQLNHDQRRAQAITRTPKRASGRRRPEFRHFMIAVVSGVAVMAVAGAALGLVPAIEAADGNGTIGTFVVGSQPCLPHRGGCAYTGTFQAPGAAKVSHVAYEGSLPAGVTSIPARYTGYQQAYALHGSRGWAVDLVIMLLIGGAVGFLVWLLPVGLGRRSGGVEL